MNIPRILVSPQSNLFPTLFPSHNIVPPFSPHTQSSHASTAVSTNPLILDDPYRYYRPAVRPLDSNHATSEPVPTAPAAPKRGTLIQEMRNDDDINQQNERKHIT